MGSSKEITDEALVSRVIAGDVDVFADIMGRYEAKLMRYVVYLIHDDAMARDVVQETFIKTYVNIKGFKPKYRFSSWIYRIAHNEAMNAIKREKHLDHSLDIDEAQDVLYEPTIIHEIDRTILQGDVRACLDELDIKYREVLMLQYYENMKYSEIADILHAPPTTVGVWAARGKAILKAICERKGVRT